MDGQAAVGYRFGLVFVVVLMLFTLGCAGGGEKKLQKGDEAPGFQATDLNGQQISMAALRGRPVILRFWSVNCQYCRADTPVFNQYFDRYREQGLQVVYINTLSTLEEVQEFVKDLDIRFPVLLDKDGVIAASYRVKLVPQTIVINPDHRIVAARLGGVGEEELKSLLGPYLEIKP